MVNVGQKGNAKVVMHSSNRLKAADQQRVTLPATLLRHAVKHSRDDFACLPSCNNYASRCLKLCKVNARI